MRKAVLFFCFSLFFVFPSVVWGQRHPCQISIWAGSTCQEARGTATDTDTSNHRRWGGAEIYESRDFSPPAIPPEDNGQWVGKMVNPPTWRIPISLDNNFSSHTIYALCRDENRASHDRWGRCFPDLQGPGTGVCAPDGMGVNLTCNFLNTGPSNLRFDCNHGGTEVTISWDPDTNPLLTQYSLRINADDNDNLNMSDDWDGSCSSSLGALGDRCIDIPKTQTSYTFAVNPVIRYSWWLHSRGQVNEFGPAVYGPLIQCNPNCTNLEVTGPNVTFDASTGGYQVIVNTPVSYSANFESLDGDVASGFFSDPVEAGAQNYANFSPLTSSGSGGGNTMTANGSISYSAPGRYILACRAWNDARTECRPGNYLDPSNPAVYACRGPNTSVPVEVIASCIDNEPPDAPSGLNISCQYVGPGATGNTYSVSLGWDPVSDNGCAGMNSLPYRAEIGHVTAGGGLSTAQGYSDSNWITTLNYDTPSGSAYNENSNIVSRVSAKDSHNNAAVSPLTTPLALNCTNCSGCPIPPPPGPGGVLFCPR